MITYSVEMLYHFRRSTCGKWWSIGDYPDTELKKPMSCPHCGKRHYLYVKSENLINEETKP